MCVCVCVCVCVRSIYFSSLVVTQQKFEGFKTTDKLQLSSAQADRPFIRQTLSTHGSRATPKESSSPFLLASPSVYFPLLLLVAPCAK